MIGRMFLDLAVVSFFILVMAILAGLMTGSI